jgi:chemotaxis protein MotB
MNRKLMKKMLFVGVIILILCNSCVTKKKYLLAENSRLDGLYRIGLLNENLEKCRDENKNQAGRIHALLADTTEMGRSLRYSQAMLNSNMSERDKLSQMLDKEMSELRKKEQTINELQEKIRAQDERVQSLLRNIKNALMGFGSDELSIQEKDGKVYVAMSDKLLFQSGSALVDKRGKEALAKLADVLKVQTDIDVMIEGHTDNKPINTAQFKDNWDLSVIRATSVVRILTKDYGIQPLQIQPSGRGEYMPVETNDTIDGRSRNRRTEIIISPKLEKLFDLLR